jgi:hypothetical protein
VRPLIDGDGRVFGRVNLVDALCALFVLALIPAAYTTWLLFRPARPRIDSVEHSRITWAETRIAGGLPIRMKLKVRGDGLTPMMRAEIGNVQAIGFTFETSTSGDVIIGENVPMGTHDLVLFEGPHEVARAPGAVSIVPVPQATIRAIGILTELDESAARTLSVGQRFDINGHPSAEILALGDVGAAHRVIKAMSGAIESPVDGSFAREAIVRIHCEPAPDNSSCRIGGMTSAQLPGTLMTIAGVQPPVKMRVIEIAPDTAPIEATLRVRVTGASRLMDLIRPGDRDVRSLAEDERGTSVASARPDRAADALDVLLRLGLDRTDDGWNHYTQPVRPGGQFSFLADKYAFSGSILDLVADEP